MSLERNVMYREAVSKDAEAIVVFYNRVGGETTYLSFEKDEYPLDTAAQTDYIENTFTQSHCTMILALVNDRIVGIGTIMSENKIKSRHIGGLGIVIEKEHQGQGIGSEVMRRLIEFCRTNGITTKIKLDTRTDNETAVALYRRLGFEIEGELKNDALVNGTYYDIYVMGMML